MSTILLLGLLAVAGYYISLRIHPLARCRWCRGTGRHYGAVYSYAHRRCRHCGGDGRKRRLGARMLP